MNINKLIDAEFVSKPIGKLKFSEQYDVIVVGLGTSGVFAAISAAREGANVLGVERSDGVGGISTRGDIVSYYYGMPGGAYEEVDKERAKAKNIYTDFALKTDGKQRVLCKMLEKNNVKIAFESIITALYTEKNAVVGVSLLQNGKSRNIACKMLIDATSEGFIIRLCGVKTALGRASDGKTVPFTSVGVYMKDNVIRNKNEDHGYANQYKPFEFSRRIIEAHSHNSDHITQTCQIIETSPQIGVREGLRFEGEEALTVSDILFERLPSRALMYAYSDIDKHGHDTAVDSEMYQNWWVISNLSTVTAKIAIPLGAVIPKGFTGIMSCGRCLSADGYSMQAVRMIRDMCRLGECVGIISAICAETGRDIQSINYSEYYYKVNKYGCFDGYSDRKFGFDYPGGQKPYSPVTWFTDFADIKEALETDCPGVAIWSVYISGKRFADELYELMTETGDELLKFNCAIALGIIEDRRALTVLRRIAENRSDFFFRDCRRSNQLRSVIAICLLGRFCDIDSLDILHEIVFSPDEFSKQMYRYDNYITEFAQRNNFNFIYFSHFTHAVMSIVKIAEKHTEIRGKVFNDLENLLSSKDYINRVTSDAPDTGYYQEIYDFGKYILKRIHS